MILAGGKHGDRGHPTGRRCGDEGGALRRRAVANLAVDVSTRCKDLTEAVEDYAVVLTGCHCRDVADRPTCSAHQDRAGAIARSTTTLGELTTRVVAPRPGGAIGHGCQAMRRSPGDVDGGSRARNSHL